MTKTSLLKFRAIATNFFWPIIYTRLGINNILADMYDFQIIFYSANCTFTLIKVKKSITKIIFMLKLANKKIFSKN